MRALRSLVEAYRRTGVPACCTIELTPQCNLQCPHCYVTRTHPDRLTRPVLIDLLDQLAGLDVFGVTFTGGEIGLRPDLFSIIGAARQRDFAVHLLSNGTLWGPEDWDRIAQLGIVGVRVSIYAARADVHDAITGVSGSHARTMATVEGLRQRGVEVACSLPVMAANVEHAADVLELAQQRELGIAIDPNITSTDRGDPGPKANLASCKALRRMWSNPGLRAWAEGRVTERECTPRSTDRPCAVGEFGCFIKCTGDVLPCVSWPQPAGSILEQSFSEIWSRSPAFAQARTITNGSLGPCSTCEDRVYCSPCPALNLSDEGAVGRPSESFCRASRAFAAALRGRA